MSTFDKLEAAIRNNPADVRWDDLLRLLRGYGFELQSVNGSHHIFVHPGLDGLYNVVRRTGSPVKPIYVKRVLEAIDEWRIDS